MCSALHGRRAIGALSLRGQQASTQAGGIELTNCRSGWGAEGRERMALGRTGSKLWPGSPHPLPATTRSSGPGSPAPLSHPVYPSSPPPFFIAIHLLNPHALNLIPSLTLGPFLTPGTKERKDGGGGIAGERRGEERVVEEGVRRGKEVREETGADEREVRCRPVEGGRWP